MTPASRGSEHTELKCVDLTDGTKQELRSSSSDSASAVTEGKTQERQQPIAMLTQNSFRSDYISLRTVPIILRNGDCSLKVNGLLDEASSKTYLNTVAAAELGLHSRTKEVRVNVLNGQIECFKTQPVRFELLTIDPKVKMRVNTYTANRVTSDMPVINWNEYSWKWPYLRKVDFPVPAKKSIVDLLIGLVVWIFTARWKRYKVYLGNQ